MRYIHTISEDVSVSQVALGCMRISNMTPEQIEHYISNALEHGINYFDHADIYGGNGLCEDLFGKALALNPRQRDR